MEVEEFLKGTRFENSRIVAFSSASGSGAELLISTIKEEILEINKAGDARGDKLTLYPVDRVFEKAGFGQILTGTLIEGRLRSDKIYPIMPEGECKVRSLESHSVKFSEVSGNIRAAVNITKTRDAEIRRGSFIVSGEIAALHRFLTVKISASKNLKHKIKSGAAVKFYFYSACYPAKLRLLERSSLEEGNECYAQIVFDEPCFTLPFKPFIVRTHTDEETIGGGLVLERSNGFIKNKKAVLERVAIFKNAGAACGENELAEVYFAGETARRGFIEITEACAAFKIPKEKILQAVSAIRPADKFFLIKDRLITDENIVRTFKSAVMDKLGAHLKANSLIAGLLKLDLIKLFAGAASCDDDNLFYSHLIDELTAEGALKIAEGILSTAARAKGSEKKLDGDSEIIRRKIMKSFDAEPLTPATLEGAKAAVPKNQADLFNKVVKFLENEKDIHRIFENYYITSGQLEKYLGAIKEILTLKKSFTVIDFKDKTNLSRKYAVAVLEFFDKTGVTVRKENERFLK
jgi:selenocysteine-specific elongation factor